MSLAFLDRTVNVQLCQETVFYQVCYEDCYYFRPPTVADLDRLDLPAAFAYFCRSFQNPAEFTVCFTGSLQVRLFQRLPDLKRSSGKYHMVLGDLVLAVLHTMLYC